MYLFCFCFFVLLVSSFLYLTYRYSNPYKLVMVFGKKGSGKTTLLAKLALRELARGKPVYTTVPVPGCCLFDVAEVGSCSFPPGSAVFIDEVGMVWDNRDFKRFRPEVRDWFKLQRHYRNKVYLFSQTFDIDVKLRNLTDAMYLCTCHFGWLSVARRIRRMITIVNPQGDSESRIADSMEFVPLWQILFGAGSLRLTFIPRWAKYFDSHEAPALPPVPFRLLDGFFQVRSRRFPWCIGSFLAYHYYRFDFLKVGRFTDVDLALYGGGATTTHPHLFSVLCAPLREKLKQFRK